MDLNADKTQSDHLAECLLQGGVRCGGLVEDKGSERCPGAMSSIWERVIQGDSYQEQSHLSFMAVN